jgi:hypothetical protein
MVHRPAPPDRPGWRSTAAWLWEHVHYPNCDGAPRSEVDSHPMSVPSQATGPDRLVDLLIRLVKARPLQLDALPPHITFPYRPTTSLDDPRPRTYWSISVPADALLSNRFLLRRLTSFCRPILGATSRVRLECGSTGRSRAWAVHSRGRATRCGAPTRSDGARPLGGARILARPGNVGSRTSARREISAKLWARPVVVADFGRPGGAQT